MRLHLSKLSSHRAGLTLVEMLIALALSIFIMAIMSEAFVKGLEAFGNYKALADLEQRLRTFANILRRDLRAPHFDGNRKLSECTAGGRAMPVLDGLKASMYTDPIAATALLRQLSPYQFKTPGEGFFSVEEWPNRQPWSDVPGAATMFFEGQDASLRPSYLDRAVFNGSTIAVSSDVLHFTSRLEGNEPDKFFYGKARAGSLVDGGGGVSAGLTRYDSASNGMYTSQAAELLYFLSDDGSQNVPGVYIPGVTTPNGPVLTFNLYRQAWLLIPSRFSDGTIAISDGTYTADTTQYYANNDVSAAPDAAGNFFYNTMADVQHRVRRMGAGTIRSPKRLPTGMGGGLDGSDIMLTNVISFDVKVFDPFAYKIPLGAVGGGPASGRGAYVDIGDVRQPLNGANPYPTAAGAALPGAGGENLQPVFGGPLNVNPAVPANIPDNGTFDTGTSRYEGATTSTGPATSLSPLQSPATHRYPFTSIQITIRVFEYKSRQTRQITIIQDM